MKQSDILRSFEIQLFRYALILSFTYNAIQIVQFFYINISYSYPYILFFNLVMIPIIYKLHQTKPSLSNIIYYSLALITSLYMWNYTGGWSGTSPYTFIVLIILIIITSRGAIQITFLLIYWTVILALVNIESLSLIDSPMENYPFISLQMDFCLNTATLILILYFLKSKFLNYKKTIEGTNRELTQSISTLELQADKLMTQQAELNNVSNNLQDIVLERIKELENKSETIQKYAYVNAHHIRGPLARILGLINIIESENKEHPQLELLKEIKKDAEYMNSITYKITEVIN